MSGGGYFNAVEPLEDAVYADFQSIGRSIHFDDFRTTKKSQAFVPAKLWSKVHGVPKAKVLWFAPSRPMSEHNEFGNVTFTIDWDDVLGRFGDNIYEIDQAVFNYRSYTRVILTKYDYSDCLTPVDLFGSGSPLRRNSSGYQHAFQCENKINDGPHELQIGIEVDDDDSQWLYFNCEESVNNHSEANSPYGMGDTYESFKCFKFNRAGKCCKYALDVQAGDAKKDEIMTSLEEADDETDDESDSSEDYTSW